MSVRAHIKEPSRLAIVQFSHFNARRKKYVLPLGFVICSSAITIIAVIYRSQYGQIQACITSSYLNLDRAVQIFLQKRRFIARL